MAEEPTLGQWLDKRHQLKEASEVADQEILKALRESYDVACDEERCKTEFIMDLTKAAKALDVDPEELWNKLREEKK